MVAVQENREVKVIFMRKILALMIVALLLFATGCQSEKTEVIEKQTLATVVETTQGITVEETTQDLTIEETTQMITEVNKSNKSSQKLADTLTDIEDIYATEQATVIQSNNPQIKYNLTDEDMEIVTAIYDQRYKWETKCDEKTEEYTWEPFNVYYLNMFYDGEKIMFVPFYIYASGPSTSMRAHQLATAFYLDSTNQLIELPDYDVSVGDFGTDSSVAQRGYVARVSTDEEKLEDIAELYYNYKKIIE